MSRRRIARVGGAGALPVRRSVDARAPFIEGTLRDYQVDGVNWILSQFALGVGGIYASFMYYGLLQEDVFRYAAADGGVGLARGAEELVEVGGGVAWGGGVGGGGGCGEVR